jgi:hypothetical protein
MKGIYLTQEGRLEIEKKISQLREKSKKYESLGHRHRRGGSLAQISILEEILKDSKEF